MDDFDSEYDARLLLTQIWKELTAKKPETDPYLDLLARVQAAGFLPEYVVTVFAKPGWTIPASVLGKLNFEGFYTWGEARGKCDHALVLRKRGFIQFEQGKLKNAYDTYQQSLRFDPASKLAFDEMTLLAHQLLQLKKLTPTEKQHYAPPASRQVTTRCTADD